MIRAALGVALVVVVGACGFGDADPGQARVERFDVRSELLGRTFEQVAVVPPGDRDRKGLLLFLHGQGDDADNGLHDAFYDALAAAGERAPIVVFASGTEDSYWHDRRDGAWGRYLAREVIPAAIARYGRRPVAIGGISMGGFGALDLVRLNPRRFCAAGAHSPALWRTGGETVAGAFDDAEDFSRHDVVRTADAAPERFARTQLWVDIGRDDPFVPGVDAFLSGLRSGGVRVRAHRWPGAHDGDYWREHWDEYMRFYADALTRCR